MSQILIGKKLKDISNKSLVYFYDSDIEIAISILKSLVNDIDSGDVDASEQEKQCVWDLIDYFNDKIEFDSSTVQNTDGEGPEIIEGLWLYRPEKMSATIDPEKLENDTERLYIGGILNRSGIGEYIDLPRTDNTRHRGIVQGLIRTPQKYTEVEDVIWEIVIRLESGEESPLYVPHESVKDLADFNGDFPYRYRTEGD